MAITYSRVREMSAYTLEFETLAVTLFNVVAAIQQENSITGAQRFFDHVRAKLEKWFQYLSPISTCPPEDREEVWEQLHRAQAYAVTFHIPLHRHLSTALTHFTELDGFYDYIKQHLLDDEIFVRIIIIHPLRIQVARTEINCGMWVRNGAQARMSALIYSQWNVSSAFQTPDVDLIRFCGAHIDKEHFAMLLATGFNVTEKVRFERAQLHGRIRHKHVLFNGCGRKSWKEEEDVTEEEIAEFHEFRNLIREKPKMVEEMIVNLDGEIAEGASFNKEDRTKFRLRLNQYNISKIVIEFGVVIMDAPTTSVMARIMARIARHQPINETSSDEEDEGDEEERREEHRDSPPNIEAPRRIIMARQFENEDAPRIPVLREPEWIDPMFWGMFKLVAEIIVVRVNSGATSEQHYRQEMVNCMAMGNVSYSRLRASIAEKGSRGSELIDKHFEAILKEIGDFVTPNEASNYLQQGTYRLKTSVWDSELCPVFFMMRSTSMKQAREVFSKMEARERKNLVDKEEDNGGVKMETNFWVPFRIIDFSETRRHQGIAQIYNLLLTERFLLNCLAVLATGPNSLAKFHEATMQLAVYLLTLGVKYAEQYKGTKEVKEYLRTIYHTPYQVTKETGNSSTYHTICSFMINLVETDARDKDSLVPLFKNILNGVYDREKIAGGRMIYLARFVTILCKLSPTCRQIIESKLAVEEIEIGKLAIKEESKKALDPAKAAAKAAAKSRMAAIMQKSAQKSAMTMQKLMASEGMSAAEVDKVDPSQQNRKVYQCPICGDQETPNTVEQPFGMLAKLSTNFVCEEQIDASCSPLQEILDFDRQANTDGLKAQLETRRNYADKRRMASVENPQPEVAKVRAPMVGTDLKTCGHAAHIACFNAYRASLYDGRHRPVDRREVGCPMCRYTVNTIVPISFDKPYTPIKTPPSPLSDPDVWKTMNLVLRKARGPVFQEDEKNVRYATLYSTRDGGGLCELWTGRQHSADWTERQSSYEKCTVSTLLVSMAVAMVERASLLRGMGVPERRKNARNSLTVHLMTASVATSKDVDFDVTLSALTSLLAKVSTHPPPPPPSSTVPPTLLSAESTPEPSTSREPTPTIEISVPGLTTDEMASLTTKTSRKRPIEGESEIRMKVPLFVLEPKSTLVRMLAILIDNVSISKEIQREIAHTIIKAITGWVSAYTTLCLVLRLGDHKIMQLKNGELKIEGLSRHQHDVVEAIAKALCSNMSFFEFMVQKLASPDVELDDAEFGKTIATATVNFLRFAAELLLHCDLGTVDTVECIQGPEITMEMVMSRMNIGCCCCWCFIIKV
uniref:E3 ubiquitin-protein ligase n=1 Tax=Caenorhabditis japonica TaxID=281687 RepID=A0A8R1DRM6_CAEJA